jgi:hypothetical protein
LDADADVEVELLFLIAPAVGMLFPFESDVDAPVLAPTGALTLSPVVKSYPSNNASVLFVLCFSGGLNGFCFVGSSLETAYVWIGLVG